MIQELMLIYLCHFSFSLKWDSKCSVWLLSLLIAHVVLKWSSEEYIERYKITGWKSMACIVKEVRLDYHNGSFELKFMNL